MKLSLEKLILLEGAPLLLPALAPYMYNSYNHAKVDSISNKKDLDLYKKNNYLQVAYNPIVVPVNPPHDVVESKLESTSLHSSFQ